MTGGSGMTDATRGLRVLIVTADFAAPGINTWLLDDLADAFIATGAQVDVLVHSPTAPRKRGLATLPNGIRVYSVGTEKAPRGPLAKIISYAATALLTHTSGLRWARSSEYDLCISTSISSFAFGIPTRIRRKRVARKWVVVLWDFFPVYHLEIGRIRQRWLAEPLRRIEERSLRFADAIAVMSPAGDRYLRKYFPGLSMVPTFSVPPWSRDGLGRTCGSPDGSGLGLVFGGQLISGRNVETLIRAMGLLPAESSAVLKIAGDGPYRSELERIATALGLRNVEFLGALPRDRYFELLSSGDVGVTTNSSTVSIPSYPSKIAGYCSMGLPILMAVEPFSDYGEQLEQAGAGIAVPAGDPGLLAQAIVQLESEMRFGTLPTRGDSARAFFETHLSSASAVQQLLRGMELT